MAEQQLALGQRGELDLGRGRQRCVARRSQLVQVHPAEDRRPRVADDPASHLRAKLLRGEEHEAEVASPLRKVDEHLADVGVLSVRGGVLVELVHEDDDVVHPQIAALQVLPELGDHPRKDEVLRQRIDPRHVEHVCSAIPEFAPGKVVGRAVVGDETLGPGGNVAEPVADLSDGGDVVGAPNLPSPADYLQEVEDRAEELLQIGEALHLEGRVPQQRVVEGPAHHPLGQKIDEGIGFRVHVVAVEHDLGVVQHLPQSPHQRLGVRREVLIAPQRVQVDAVGLERRVIVDVGERLGSEAEPLIEMAIFFGDRTGLIQEAEIRPLHVEAERRHRPLVGRKRLEHAREQELDRAGLGRKARHTADVEVRGLGPEQEVAVEIDRRLEAAGRVHANRNAGGPLAIGVGIHSERETDVGIGREMHRTQRYRLERLFRCLAERSGEKKADLGAFSRLEPYRPWIAVGADHRMERCHEIGVRKGIGHHAVHRSPGRFDPNDGPDADGRVPRRPEPELVGGGGFELGGNHPTDDGMSGHGGRVLRKR